MDPARYKVYSVGYKVYPARYKVYPARYEVYPVFCRLPTEFSKTCSIDFRSAGMVWRGECLTLNTSECPSVECLGGILMKRQKDS